MHNERQKPLVFIYGACASLLLLVVLITLGYKVRLLLFDRRPMRAIARFVCVEHFLNIYDA
jgi:hypothetical protein